MIVIDASTRKLEVVLAAAPVAQLQWVTTYVALDTATKSLTPHTATGVTNSTTAVTIVPATTPDPYIQVKYISVYNSNSATATVTVSLNDNSSLRTLYKAALPAGAALYYSDTRGWYTLTSLGALSTLASGVDLPADADGLLGNDGAGVLSWDNPVTLERGGTEADLSATGPGVIIQASSGAPFSIAAAGDEGDVLTQTSGVPTWAASPGSPGAVPVIVGSAYLTAQTLSVGPTVIVDDAPDGFYRISVVIVDEATLGNGSIVITQIGPWNVNVPMWDSPTAGGITETITLEGSQQYFNGSVIVGLFDAADITYTIYVQHHPSDAWGMYMRVEYLGGI